MSIEVRDITKTFGVAGREFRALDHVTLKVPAGELVALLGPSGSGKTTLLRIIAGLEVADQGSGEVYFHDENVAGQRVGERNVGFVFQHYALFKHMTVFENIAFGMRVRPRRQRPSREQISARVMELLRLVQLEGLAQRYPAQLSGGQRQRVALARALGVEPRVLLLDEPFGALDAKVRLELRRWLRRLHDEIHLTSVFVTHDQEEALEVADRVVVMNRGRIEQVGTPEEVFHQPASEFVMNFLGHVNLFHGRMEGDRLHLGAAPDGTAPESPAAQQRVFVRPHDLEVAREASAEAAFRATIDRVNSAGPTVKIELTSEFGEIVQVEMPHDRFRPLGLRTGEQVYVVPRQVKVFVEDYSI
jgi:sulfate transport system ATP-binding protein